MGDSITVTAPAKVNLFLHITGRRADGYHLLESLFAFTRHGDEITLKAAPALSLKIEGPFAGALMADADDNLVLKAARALASAGDVPARAEIILHKNLPIASGIGGGSADAAAALRGLSDLWGLGLSSAQLETIAYSLGADVPACLYNTPQFVEGVGEKLSPVSLSWQVGILLVNPGVMLSTPAVFKAFQANGSHFDVPLGDAHPWDTIPALAERSHNSLEAPAVATCPQVAEVLMALAELDGVQLARMSGSGATCFALFESGAAARQAATLMKNKHSNWWLMADELVASDSL